MRLGRRPKPMDRGEVKKLEDAFASFPPPEALKSARPSREPSPLHATPPPARRTPFRHGPGDRRRRGGDGAPDSMTIEENEPVYGGGGGGGGGGAGHSSTARTTNAERRERRRNSQFCESTPPPPKKVAGHCLL